MHTYGSACLCFTFAFRHDGVDPLGQYDLVKSAIQQAFVNSGGTLAHHHAVGTEHAAWLEQDISAPGVHMIDGLLAATDPQASISIRARSSQSWPDPEVLPVNAA